MVAIVKKTMTVSMTNLTFLRRFTISPNRPAIDLMTTATIPRTIINHFDVDNGWPRFVAN